MNWCTHYTINDKQNYPLYKLKLLAIKFNHWRFVQPSQDLIIGLYVFKPTNCLQSWIQYSHTGCYKIIASKIIENPWHSYFFEHNFQLKDLNLFSKLFTSIILFIWINFNYKLFFLKFGGRVKCISYIKMNYNSKRSWWSDIPTDLKLFYL